MAQKHQSRKYSIVAHDPAWLERFALLEAQFAKTFDDCQADIYHVGGTAIIGLPSQPIVDMLVVVPDIHCLEHHLAELRQFGYTIEHDYVGPETILAYKETDDVRLENIHILPQGHEQIDNFLAVKEYLEAFPEEAAEYGEKKLELYEKYPNDYVAYRKDRDAWLREKLQADILPWFNDSEVPDPA